jgi:murein L,D-transpeptidase YcbB/YkuD
MMRFDSALLAVVLSVWAVASPAWGSDGLLADASETSSDAVAVPFPDLPETLNIDKLVEAERARLWAEIPVPDFPDRLFGLEPTSIEAKINVPLPDLEPLPPPAAIDIIGGDVLRAAFERLLGETVHPRIGRALRDEVMAFYGSQGFRPFFVARNGISERGRGVVDRLRLAADDGLDPMDYDASKSSGSSVDELAAAEWRIATMAVAYARDARGARVDPSRLSSMITVKRDLPSAGEVLEAVARSANASSALEQFNPRHDGYLRLRSELAKHRATYGSLIAARPIRPGKILKVGMSDPRVPLIRSRFGVPPETDETYDNQVASAVAAFQKERGLASSGRFDRATVEAIADSSPRKREADILVNMERWRWMPRHLGERHVFVNVPEYKVRYVRAGRTVYETRAIVGKPETQTPLFSDEMEHLVVNPSWYVPPSILKKEFIPKLALDPTYAERRGYIVTRTGNSISIRQPPGERNALGNIKFMFPNQHSVYLHDTPGRHLFRNDRRAFSHGCVRVDRPFALAELVLEADGGWSEDRVRALVGRGERTIKLKNRVSVHLAYFTALVDETASLKVLPDLYGHDRRLRSALGLDG